MVWTWWELLGGLCGNGYPVRLEVSDMRFILERRGSLWQNRELILRKMCTAIAREVIGIM